jgi:large subunit ribosomal protein L35
MPKMKTHSGAKKRFKVSGSGKLMRRKTGKNHLLEHKTSKLKRGKDGRTEVAKADQRQVKKLLGR